MFDERRYGEEKINKQIGYKKLAKILNEFGHCNIKTEIYYFGHYACPTTCDKESKKIENGKEALNYIEQFLINSLFGNLKQFISYVLYKGTMPGDDSIVEDLLRETLSNKLEVPLEEFLIDELNPYCSFREKDTKKGPKKKLHLGGKLSIGKMRPFIKTLHYKIEIIQ